MIALEHARKVAAAITNSYRFVAFTANANEITPTTVAGAASAGVVSKLEATIGRSVPVTILGIAKVTLDGTPGTVVPGSPLSIAGTAGTAKLAVSTNIVAAYAIQGGVAGDIIECFVVPPVNIVA